MALNDMEIKFKELNADVAEQVDKIFPKKSGFIEVMPGNIIMPRKFSEIGKSIRTLKTNSDDIWVVSYPRTGSTWAQELIWLLGNHMDFEGAKEMLQLRAPIVELSALFSDDHLEWVNDALGDTLETIRKMPRPRFVRSHLPLHLLPKNLIASKAKIIYTARNPKDLCVSFYHYCKLMHGLKGSMNDFTNLFLNEHTPIGSYWNHVLPFWKLRNEPNVLFLKYEEMNRNLAVVVRKCAEFLDVKYLIGEENMSRMCEHLKFDNMQKNSAVNLDPLLNQILTDNGRECKSSGEGDVKFIRKGQIGDWKNYLTGDVSKTFNVWIDKNTKETGLSFDYE